MGITSFILSLLVLHLITIGRNPIAHPQAPMSSRASKEYKGKTGFALRNAEVKLAGLIAKNRCSGRPKCKPPVAWKLRAATRKMQKAARAERLRLRLQAPLFRTFVFEPMYGPALGTLLLLHGFEGNPRSVVRMISKQLHQGLLKNVRIVAPMAFERPNEVYRRTGSAWFEIPADSASWKLDQVLAATSNASATLDTTCRVLKLPRKSAAVAGVSLGAALSLAFPLRHEAAVVGSLVGFLPIRPDFIKEFVARKDTPSVIMMNAIEDLIVPLAGARASWGILRTLGFSVDYSEVPGVGHDLGNRRDEVLSKLLRFLRDKMDLPEAEDSKYVINEKVQPVVWELL